jgi:serine/threonine protein kinase
MIFVGKALIGTCIATVRRCLPRARCAAQQRHHPSRCHPRKPADQQDIKWQHPCTHCRPWRREINGGRGLGATMTAGTPSYMAPEQAMGVTPLDRRVDIYSLTAVTYAMLTGHPPFLVRSIADIVARDTSQPPQPIAERLGAPDTLDAVMVSGLAADRNRRPPSALLLAEALEMIAGQISRRGHSSRCRKRS